MDTTQTQEGDLLGLGEEELMLQSTMRRFAEVEVLPGELKRDKTKEFPLDLIAKMASQGFLGIPVPPEYGGAGMSTLAYALAVEEIAKVSGSLALTLAAHTSLGTMPIIDFGDEEQKQKYVPPLAAGEYLGSFGLTEPQAGSDAGATRTTAVRDGDHYVLNGQKAWITNAGAAGCFVVTARTSPGTSPEGISAFIVLRGVKGFHIGEPEKKLGLHSSDSRPIFFDDCRVHSSQRLGPEGEGFKYFMKTLDRGRIVIGAMALGLAQGAFERSLKYSTERRTFDKPLFKHQAIAFKLADMSIEIDGARLLAWEAAFALDRGDDGLREATLAFQQARRVALDVADGAVQVFGGHGYIREYLPEMHLRNARGFAAFEALALI